MMRIRCPIVALLTAILLGGVAVPASAQRVDPALRGNWTLDVAASTFGPDGAPTAGTVRWTEHGWVLAVVFGGGYVYADAVITDHGCSLIGVPEDFSCAIAVLSPRHVRFTLRQGDAIRRVSDIELTDANTTRAIHHVTPASGAPYTETGIWRRERE